MVGALYWVLSGLVAIGSAIALVFTRNYYLSNGSGAINWDSIRWWAQANIIDPIRTALQNAASSIYSYLSGITPYINYIYSLINYWQIVLTNNISQALGLIEYWIIPRISTLEQWRNDCAA
jgi:hypothetical protein